MQLHWYLYSGPDGEHDLLVVHDSPMLGSSCRRVDCLFSNFLPFKRWRLRRALRRLRRRWVDLYISGLHMPDPHEIVR